MIIDNKTKPDPISRTFKYMKVVGKSEIKIVFLKYRIVESKTTLLIVAPKILKKRKKSMLRTKA